MRRIDINKIKNSKAYTIMIVAILFVAIGAFSFAFFVAQGVLGDDAKLTVTTEGVGTLVFTPGTPVNLVASIDNFYEGAGSLFGETTSTANLKAPENYLASYNVQYVINNNNFEYTTADKTPELILTITDPNGNIVTAAEAFNNNGYPLLSFVTVIDSKTGEEISGFDITEKSGTFTINSNKVIIGDGTSGGVTEEWKAKVTFVNLDTEQTLNEDKTLNSQFILSANPEIPSSNAATEILNLQDETDGLIRHTSDIATSAGDGNFRYSGADPNNYVTFNNESWRIIGIFDGHLKIIKEEPIPLTEENKTTIVNYGNENVNEIMMEYYHQLDVKSKSLISKKIIKISHFEATAIEVTPKEMYINESKDKRDFSKYGLFILPLLANDYLYAADENYWNLVNVDWDNQGVEQYYNNVNVANSNWLADATNMYDHNSADFFDNIKIEPTWFYHDNNNPLNIEGLANIANGGIIHDISQQINLDNYVLRPTTYLKQEVEIESGTGTKNDPFILTEMPTIADKIIEMHDESDGLYQHTTGLANSAEDNNYRYSGSDESVNNHVQLVSAENKDSDNFRIIGIFDGEIKLIENFGSYDFLPNGNNTDSFDVSNKNNWDDASLNMNLISDIFQFVGIEYNWNIGAISSYTNVKPKDIFDEEIVTKTTNKYYVGLMNPSDYLFAASPSYWSFNNYSGNTTATNDYYDNTSMMANNWMHIYDNGEYEWTMNPVAGSSTDLYHIRFNGFTSSYGSNASNSYGYRLVLYLNQSLDFKGGSGTSSDPFVIEYYFGPGH